MAQVGKKEGSGLALEKTQNIPLAVVGEGGRDVIDDALKGICVNIEQECPSCSQCWFQYAEDWYSYQASLAETSIGGAIVLTSDAKIDRSTQRVIVVNWIIDDKFADTIADGLNIVDQNNNIPDLKQHFQSCDTEGLQINILGCETNELDVSSNMVGQRCDIGVKAGDEGQHLKIKWACYSSWWCYAPALTKSSRWDAD